MSRKNKPSKTHAKPLAPHAMDDAALVLSAEAALSASHFKEAIEFYKELVKRERRADWVDGLASCYAARALDLAAKGMVKEALVLWRNRADLCGKPLVEATYVDLLLQAGEQNEVLRLLAEKDVPAEVLANLETRLAAIVLLAPDAALAHLPADSLLLRHRAPAREALAAYQRGDFAAMEMQLQSIPFRSPYRDLRPILKALVLLTPNTPKDAELLRAEALSAIARVPADGPFERLLAVIRAAAEPGARWLTALRDMDDGSRQLLLNLKGCPDKLHTLVIELARLGDAPAAPLLFDLLVRHRGAMPEGVAAGLCRRLLPHALERQKVYTTSFGRFSEDEREHVFALGAELQQLIERAEDHWEKMGKALSASPGKKLYVALILRHMAEGHDGHAKEGRLCGEAISLLSTSLDFDPEDRNVYLKLIRAFRADTDLASARSYLDKVLPRFPKDAEILLEAVETALAGKAFKKASVLAKKVLELDPINPKVRALIGHAHLSHARKLIKSASHMAALKELDAADEWMRTPTDRATVKLLRAIVEEKGDLLREAVADLGGFLVGGFYLLLEAARIGYDATALLRRAGIDLSITLSVTEIMAFAHVLNAVPDGEKSLRAAIGPLRAPLKRAAKASIGKAPFSEADQQLLCEALQRRKEHELVIVYAEAALKRWPGRPVFIYLKMLAKYGNNPDFISQRDLSILEQAAARADQQGDQRTALRIDELLSKFDGPDWAEDDLDGEFLDDMPLDDPRAVFELLLAMGGEKAFLDMARNALGEQLFLELKKQLGGNKKDFAQALIDRLMQLGAPSLLPPTGKPMLPPLNKPAPKPPFINPNQKGLFDD